VYGLVAIPCGLVIAIGLPLLLTLEPFLNHKIKFTGFKPLLDQFQGCYKDKYRCFASFYMICRLIILVVINIMLLNNIFLTLYLLLCAIIVLWLINATVQPYSCNIINTVDNLILLIMVLAMSLQVIELSNGFAANAVIAVAFVFAVMPLLTVFLSGVLLNKNQIGRCISCCSQICKSKEAVETTTQDIEMTDQEYQIVVDDNLRQKCRTIV